MKTLEKRGQISIEYLVLIGFVTLVVIGILGVSVFYIGNIREAIGSDQLGHFSDKVISSAETVYYSGEPSKLTITAYLPSGVSSINVQDQSLVFVFTSNSGTNTIAYPSKAPISINGSLSYSEGLKKLKIAAEPNQVLITELS